MTPTAPTARTPGATMLRIRVHLVDSDPEIWRLLEVDSGLRLDHLHVVLQIAMGWENTHLHSFFEGEAEAEAGIPVRTPAALPREWMPAELLEDNDSALPEHDVTIGQVLTDDSGPLFYDYDFGDEWVHRIDLIETIPTKPADPGARLICGERRGPPEDCGGIAGYAEVLRVLADPADEEHDEYREWVGEKFDPDEFDQAAVDRALAALFAPSRKRRATKKPAARATAKQSESPTTEQGESPRTEQSESPPSVSDTLAAAGVRHVPGMAERMLRDLAPLLAAEGIDLDDPATFDVDTLNAALARATERSNLERFTPVGGARDSAITVIRLVSEAISEGQDARAEAAIAGVEPEPTSPRAASVAGVIGAGLGLLDGWHTDAALAVALARSRPPRWNKNARAAATDMLALARKGRAFDAIGSLHLKYSGFVILEGTLLAVAASLVSWAGHENDSIHDIATRAVR